LKGTVIPVKNFSREESLSDRASQTVLDNETLELTWKYFKILHRMHFYKYLNTMKERKGQTNIFINLHYCVSTTTITKIQLINYFFTCLRNRNNGQWRSKHEQRYETNTHEEKTESDNVYHSDNKLSVGEITLTMMLCSFIQVLASSKWPIRGEHWMSTS
jgi:hypothetical protein